MGAVKVVSGLIVSALLAPQGQPFDPSSWKPFTDGAPYLGKYETGLYPTGKNTIPQPHQKAGERIAATLQPLDLQGKPAPSGRILALALGHSNCNMYFSAIGAKLGENAPRLHPRFELLNAAVGGQQLPEIVRLQGPVWDKAQKLTTRDGYSPLQVQVLFLHTTYHGWKNKDKAPLDPFPRTMERMQADLSTVLAHVVKTYPNVKLAYLTADGFRHFTDFEPHVWQEAFAIKWLIESQIQKAEGTAFDGDARRLPWLQWGPYLWDNTWGRDYFTDGVHPARKALDIVSEKYWKFLAEDPVAQPWLMKPSEPK
jgi:hypothetical protein